jgi:hypothetical protein
MEHREAKRQNVARRYMIGELSTVEREDFEGHYFDCVVCADEVRSIVHAGASARTTVRESSPWGWFGAFWQWRPTSTQLLAPACLALVFLSYQTLQMRGQLAPQSVSTYRLAPEARAAESAIDRSARFVVLAADAPEMADEVKWQIRNAEGGSAILEGVVKNQPGRALNLLIPVGRLAPATYLLSLQDTGLMAPEIAYRFRMH